MFRIDDPTAVAVLPTPEAVGTPGYFTEGSPGVQVPTNVRASFMNMLQEEFIAVCVAAGITPSKTTYNQLLTALRSAGVFQTPSPGDNTTKAATTAFLAAALTAKFKGTLGTNGYASFEVDDAGTKKTFIVQRGRVAVTDNTIATVTLPFTFPTACRFVGATPDCAAAVGGTDIIAAHASIVSPSQITVGVSTNNGAIVSTGAYWLAIGE